MSATVQLFSKIIQNVKTSKQDVHDNLLKKLKEAGKLDGNISLPKRNKQLIIQFGKPKDDNMVSIIQITNLNNNQFRVIAGN